MFRIHTYKTGSLFAALFILVCVCNSKAQNWQTNIQNDSNFFSIQRAFYAEPDNKPADGEEDGQIELYKRWEAFTLPRVYPSGNPVAPDIIYKEWAKYQASRGMSKRSYPMRPWYYIGPKKAPVGGGTGRINCIVFKPGNPKIMWAGTASGGLWRSTNGGLNWSTNTDNLPDLSVTDVAINPRNPDTMYMATGDGFGYTINNGTHFGGTYSNGIMRSINGGLTWDTTGLNWTLANVRQITHLLILPENPNIILASTNAGIMRSTDAGSTWTNVHPGPMSDIKMNEASHGLMYAAGAYFYTSKDTGRTWQLENIKFPATTGAIAVATTAANPAIVYIALYNNYSNQGSTVFLMKSSDSGFTWQNAGAVSGKFYGYYTSALRVSPYDSNNVVAGGVDVMRTTNGGASWSQLTYNQYPGSQGYAHADHRVFVYYPGSKDTMFDGDDGGIYMSTNGGTAWKLVSDDIHSLEFYRMGNSATDTTIIYAGAQDNGVNEFYNGTWKHVIGGDGMTCQVSSQDPGTAYGSWQYGNVQKTSDYGNSWQTIYPTGYNTTNWTTPFVLDPANPDTIYFGGTKLYESTDGGLSTWTNITAKLSGDIQSLAVAPDDDAVIYIVFGSDQTAPGAPRMYRTSNAGKTWVNISKGTLSSANTYQTGVDVERENPATVATCFSGFNAKSKVFISKDTGATWTNISAGLPNVPVDCIKFEGSVQHGIFVGTDVGVFYSSDSTNGWIPYMDGLPNVMVDQIEIFPAYNKIRACTFGRGIYDGYLSGTISGIEKISELKTEISIYPNPSINGIFNIQLPKGQNQSPILNVYNIIGQSMMAPQKLSGYNNGGLTQLNLSNLPGGIYIVNLNYPDGVVSQKVQVMK